MSAGNKPNFKALLQSNSNESIYFSSFSLALVSRMWSYDGWGDSVSLNEEVHDLNRNLRLGIITRMLFVITCLFLLKLVFVLVLYHREIRSFITVATAFIDKLKSKARNNHWYPGRTRVFSSIQSCPLVCINT